MRDLYITDHPTQETCAIVDHAEYTDPARLHELDHARAGLDDISALKKLYHVVGMICT